MPSRATARTSATPAIARNPRSAPEDRRGTDGQTDGRIQAAFADILDEALSIFALPSARLELTLRVRRAHPAPMRDLLLHAMVRFLHDRCEHARRIEAATGVTHSWEQMFPELPITMEDALLMAGPELVGVGS